MTKSTKPKRQPDQPNIHVGGDVIGDNIIIGHGNTISFQEPLKITYRLFTIPQPVTDFTGREAELAGLKASFTNGAIITGLSGAGGIDNDIVIKRTYNRKNIPLVGRYKLKGVNHVSVWTTQH